MPSRSAIASATSGICGDVGLHEDDGGDHVGDPSRARGGRQRTGRALGRSRRSSNGHQVEPRLVDRVVQPRGGGSRRRPGRSTRRRPRSAGHPGPPASAGSARSPRPWRRAPGRDRRGPSRRWRPARRRTGGRRRRAGMTPAAARRPWRTTWTAQRAPPRGSSSRRAATSWGMRVRAVSRWVRATARTKAASRSRWTPASSKRSSSARRPSAG